MFLRYGPEETNRGFDTQRRSNLKGESQPMATCDASRKHKCIKVTIHACSEYTNICLKGTVFNWMIFRFAEGLSSFCSNWFAWYSCVVVPSVPLPQRANAQSPSLAPFARESSRDIDHCSASHQLPWQLKWYQHIQLTSDNSGWSGEASFQWKIRNTTKQYSAYFQIFSDGFAPEWFGTISRFYMLPLPSIKHLGSKLARKVQCFMTQHAILAIQLVE